MWKSFRIGSLFGIPLRLDITFLIILPVFAWIIGAQIEIMVDILNDFFDAGIDATTVSEGNRPWILGFISAIGLFVGVVLHELGHSLTARRYGFPIESITLWLLGGVASFREMPEDWRQELNIAIAGPIVSIAVGVLSYGLFLITPEFADSVGTVTFQGALFVFSYLAILNVFLAVFNMIPAFPMDGGRVLRALLARNRPYAKATQQAASIGRMFAIFFGIFGLLAFNIILIAIAFFIYIAASGEERHVMLKAAFEGVTIGDIMTPKDRLRLVEPSLTIDELIQRMFRERHTGYPVMTDGRLIGLVTLADAQQAQRSGQQGMTVENVMSTDLETIDPDTDVMEAIDRMQREKIGRLLVVDNDQLVGLVTRTDVMTALEILQRSGTMAFATTEVSSERPQL